MFAQIGRSAANSRGIVASTIHLSFLPPDLSFSQSLWFSFFLHLISSFPFVFSTDFIPAAIFLFSPLSSCYSPAWLINLIFASCSPFWPFFSPWNFHVLRSIEYPKVCNLYFVEFSKVARVFQERNKQGGRSFERARAAVYIYEWKYKSIEWRFRGSRKIGSRGLP